MHTDYEQDTLVMESPSSPFADIFPQREAAEFEQITELEDSILPTPFAATMGGAPVSVSDPRAAARMELEAALHDQEFNEVLYNVAGELLERGDSHRSNGQFEVGGTSATLAQQAYVNQLLEASDAVISQTQSYFEQSPTAALTENEIGQLFERFTVENPGFTPVQEQFLGKIVGAVKNVVKKGIKAVSKVLPIGAILSKLKPLIKPLLERVLKFAIGKLPSQLQPHARTLAKKFLNIDAETSFEMEMESASSPDDIQREFNERVGNVALAESESDADREAYEYGTIPASTDTLDLTAARKRFVNELKQLKPGGDAQPAIENFLPVALMALQPVIKTAISIIGRDQVIGFLAKPMAGLVNKYIPESIALPLATKIIDIGLGAIGFETAAENPRPDLTYEAIANTIEETISGMDVTPLASEATEENLRQVRQSLLSAFEQAAANNFPNDVIKQECRTTTQNGVWVLMPRGSGNYQYKKFSRIFNVTLDNAKVRNIKTFRHLPLANFLRDKFNIDLSTPVPARIHVYEAIEGTWLSKITLNEKVPGLGSATRYAWVQLHPLTTIAAAALLGESGLGRDFSPDFTNSRHRIAVGQRFYYLELGRTMVKPPPNRPSVVRPPTPPGATPLTPPSPSVPRSSDVQCVLSFKQSQIRLNCYFSEADAVATASKLRNNDYLGAAASIQSSIRNVLHGILLKNAGSKIKIIHEAMPELYMENFVGAAARAIGGAVAGKATEIAMDVLKKVVERIAIAVTDAAIKAVGNYFRTRASEFIAAQADVKDGVTVKVIFSSVPGMSAISAVIQAVKGNLTLGNVADLALPPLPIPDVQVKSDKHFD